MPGCPWCRRTFATWPLARIHVKNCAKAPRPRWKDPRRGKNPLCFRLTGSLHRQGGVVAGQKEMILQH